jgi:hypothetical protein
VGDKEYREQKARVQKYIDKWFKTLGLGWFLVDMEWSREHDGEVAARTSSSWQYKDATITWFLPHLVNQSDDTVERTVVHEFCHILLSGLAQNQKDSNESLASQVNEYTTELVASALIWVREAGEKTNG